MTQPSTYTTFTKQENTGKEKMLQQETKEDTAKFKETIVEELRLLKRVSQNLKNYRKMIQVKKYD
jgi:hypothetical protein